MTSQGVVQREMRRVGSEKAGWQIGHTYTLLRAITTFYRCLCHLDQGLSAQGLRQGCTSMLLSMRTLILNEDAGPHS